MPTKTKGPWVQDYKEATKTIDSKHVKIQSNKYNSRRLESRFLFYVWFPCVVPLIHSYRTLEPQHFLQLNPLSPSRIVCLNQWENNIKTLRHFLSDFAGERFCQSKPGDLPAETDLADKPILRLRPSMKSIPYHGLQRPSFNEFSRSRLTRESAAAESHHNKNGK